MNKRYMIAVLLLIAIVLFAAGVIHGGDNFRSVALISFGFLLGWLSALISKLVYKE